MALGGRFKATLLAVSLLSGVASCIGVVPAEFDPDARIDVSGTYRYQGNLPNLLTGTITFEQDGDLVVCTDTTYDSGSNRRLRGEAVINGNRLQIPLVPQNGDADYIADVEFIFDETGNNFSVGFSDTNGDTGSLGYFTGTRTP